MVYKASIPASGDFISVSQKDIKGNYVAINEVWGSQPRNTGNRGDHVSLLEPNTDYQGKHKKTVLVEQSSDPSTSANEAYFYAKQATSVSELYYYRSGDSAGNQITGGGRASVGGLVLRAFVLFDFQGKIIEKRTVDNEGSESFSDIAYNVTSVTPNQPLLDGVNVKADWNINFTSALPTADYFWSIQSFQGPETPSTTAVIQIQPHNSATYSDSVSTTRFRAVGFNFSNSLSPPLSGRIKRVLFRAYTVAT